MNKIRTKTKTKPIKAVVSLFDRLAEANPHLKYETTGGEYFAWLDLHVCVTLSLRWEGGSIQFDEPGELRITAGGKLLYHGWLGQDRKLASERPQIKAAIIQAGLSWPKEKE